MQDSVIETVALVTKLEQQNYEAAIPPFGQSLHIDLYGVSKEICDDLSFCYQLLDDLADFLDMHKQSPPFIFRSPDKAFPEKAGLSGWVPLIESGISIHTLTVKEFVSIDVYTCGHLDIEKTIQWLSEVDPEAWTRDRWRISYSSRSQTYQYYCSRSNSRFCFVCVHTS